jgi:hypothetical protein
VFLVIRFDFPDTGRWRTPSKREIIYVLFLGREANSRKLILRVLFFLLRQRLTM